MGEPNSDPDSFLALFTDFEHTAYRLEVRTSYGVAGEDEPYQRFLAGDDPGVSWLQPWLDVMSEQTGQGKRVERVRVVDDPPSDYLRWELANTPHNLKAGEDIRYLSREKAMELRLPQYDYWVFDSRLLVSLRFDKDDRFLGFESDDDAGAVLLHLQWRDAAWHHALTFEQYING
ncbi:DUF6879 family protein [Wenjunlia tyrosinilytica]|uniref:DUF6879 domain-containing protein n=1 Tax=Wenjunlia tyrosinilytica TaxID=1544741 RepID=A0A917ZLI5_9ACTN|nr:DUF6879 family protein [Wenjunlia tyrosinilytica]GGO85243.1 hypothetical protein GCM10012280_18580 [Wenjunlia tyrosinilytica]